MKTIILMILLTLTSAVAAKESYFIEGANEKKGKILSVKLSAYKTIGAVNSGINAAIFAKKYGIDMIPSHLQGDEGINEVDEQGMHSTGCTDGYGYAGVIMTATNPKQVDAGLPVKLALVCSTTEYQPSCSVNDPGSLEDQQTFNAIIRECEASPDEKKVLKVLSLDKKVIKELGKTRVMMLDQERRIKGYDMTDLLEKSKAAAKFCKYVKGKGMKKPYGCE